MSSAVLLLVLSPIMATLALAIVVTMPGPVLYGGVRIGRYGRPFRMWKFRSMIVGADTQGPSSTADDDPRMTPLGRWMRRYKQDELPQLFNVLLGEMSLVGPRPQVQWMVDRYSAEERLVLSVRPGVTDLASLQFADEGAILKGSADPDQAYLEKIHPEKMRLSLAYVRNPGFFSDCRILLMTVLVALGRSAPRTQSPAEQD